MVQRSDPLMVQDIEIGLGASATEISEPEPPQILRLPSKRYSSVARNLRWTFFTVYERLSILVLIPNLVSLIVLSVQPDTFGKPQTLITPVAVNVMVAVLIRQDDVVNFLFWSLAKTPKSLPFILRRRIAKLYHLGGIHSGSGIAALLWFFGFNAAVMEMMTKPEFEGIRRGTFGITIMLDVLLISIVCSSLPQFRSQCHNVWEQIHRFAGWLGVILFWILLFLFCEVDTRIRTNTNLAVILFSAPSFYCLLITTIALVLPWIRLKKVAVRAEVLSNHAVQLHFTYTNLAVCTTPRFSDKPLKEWHAFAAIPAETEVGYSVIVSKAGDWTTRIIKNPPTELWTRGSPARGALYMAHIFRRVVLVGTGAGIAPIVGLLRTPGGLDCRIFWSTPNPEKVFDASIIEAVKDADPNAVIWDTHVNGRPDLVNQAYQLYKNSNAEAVFLISNAAVTRKFVYRLECRGVPTFAPIFDS